MSKGATPSKCFVVAKRTGRLANRIILFAHFIGHAEENKAALYNVAFQKYAHLFRGSAGHPLTCPYPQRETSHWIGKSLVMRILIATRGVYQLVELISLVCRKLLPSWKWIKVIRLPLDSETRVVDLNEPLVQMKTSSAKYVFYQGWEFRDVENVAKHADKIRDFFTLIAPHRENVQQFLSSAKTDCDIFVGVHVRHGDYKEHLGGKYFYPVEKYRNWMSSIENQYAPKKVKFLVCTNGHLEREDFADHSVIFGPGDMVEDLYCLAGCDCLIGPPSTYSQWASFFGNIPLCQVRDPDAKIDFSSFDVATLDLED